MIKAKEQKFASGKRGHPNDIEKMMSKERLLIHKNLNINILQKYSRPKTYRLLNLNKQ